jgi:hypothetical protein
MLLRSTATTLLLVAILQTGFFEVASSQTLREKLALRRLHFGNSTIQSGDCVAVAAGTTLTLTIEVLETSVAKFNSLVVLGLSGVRQSLARGPPGTKKITLRWSPTPTGIVQEKRLCFRAMPTLGFLSELRCIVILAGGE